MTTKRMTFALPVLALVFALSPGLLADPWNVGDQVTYSLASGNRIGAYTYGGTFLGYGGLFEITNQTTGVKVYTFCLEIDEFISNPSYVQGVSGIAQLGGRNTNSGDPLSDAARWLYAQYLAGAVGYQNVKALQLAIWWLEDEFYDWQKGSYATALDNWAAFYNGKVSGVGTAAKNYVTAALANAGSAPSNIYVLTLRGGSDGVSGAQRQDYLVRVSEPTTLILLGSGLLMTGLLRRRPRP